MVENHSVLCMLRFSFLKSKRTSYPCIALSVKKVTFAATVTGRILRSACYSAALQVYSNESLFILTKAANVHRMSTETEVAELFPNTLVRTSDISSFISWYTKQTSSMKKKFNYTHEYWLESFLPISGQFIFWRSIRMMQMKRIKFICGEYITKVMWEKHWGISHCI